MENECLLVKEIGNLVKVKKGEMIYRIGEKIDMFFYIDTGMIKLAEDSLEGKAITISLNRSSEFIGYVDYLNGKNEYTQYATALTDTVLYSIPLDFLNESSKVKQIVIDSMILQLTEAHQLIFVLSTMTVPEKLSWLLKKLAKRKDGFLVIDHPITHEEMSNILGCSRQKITTFLSKWKKEGYLKNERGMIKIINEEKLR